MKTHAIFCFEGHCHHFITTATCAYCWLMPRQCQSFVLETVSYITNQRNKLATTMMQPLITGIYIMPTNNHRMVDLSRGCWGIEMHEHNVYQ